LLQGAPNYELFQKITFDHHSAPIEIIRQVFGILVSGQASTIENNWRDGKECGRGGLVLDGIVMI
jgi:hypothetical protein